MSYAKTSLRAEQRALREKMRELRMSHQQITVEFARRYRVRPSAAWRSAHGWSLTEAAERISSYAASVGLSGGATVAMTAAHLSEHENWPGEGPEPTGRRPTPYLLSLLAGVYGCAVHDLLGAADCEHMPAADRLILERTGPTRLHQVNIAVTLGDAGTAVDVARGIDLSTITVTERKATLLIDTARAYLQWGRHEKACIALRVDRRRAPWPGQWGRRRPRRPPRAWPERAWPERA